MRASVNHSGEKKQLNLKYNREDQFKETCSNNWKGVQINVSS